MAFRSGDAQTGNFMPNTAILWPMVALAALTFVVWGVMFARRIPYIAKNRIPAAAMAVRGARPAEPARVAAPNDNLLNLFELPVLFHAVCLAMAVTGTATGGLIAAAWVYVALRAVHSAIHVSYNDVMHRFAAYLVSTLVLFGMWIGFAVNLMA